MLCRVPVGGIFYRKRIDCALRGGHVVFHSIFPSELMSNVRDRNANNVLRRLHKDV